MTESVNTEAKIHLSDIVEQRHPSCSAVIMPPCKLKYHTVTFYEPLWQLIHRFILISGLQIRLLANDSLLLFP